MSSKYSAFKNVIGWSVKKHGLKPPYFLWVVFKSYIDIDNGLKPIIDAIEHTLSNDRDIHKLYVDKFPRKRGKPGLLEIYACTFNEEMRSEPVKPPFKIHQ